MSNFFDGLIKAIQDGTTPQKVEIDGVVYTTRPLHTTPAEPTIPALRVSTLTGIKDALRHVSQTESEDGNHQLFLHVKSPTNVVVSTMYDLEALSRHVLVSSDCNAILGSTFPTGTWHKQDDFVLSSLSCFEKNDERDRMVGFASNVVYREELRTSDDGTSLHGTVKQGLTGGISETFNNPVWLKPRLTFHEIEQPKIPYILRARKAERGDGNEFLLQSADSGKWKLKAILRIQEWLEANISDYPIIA